MPNLDFTDIIYDPDLCDGFSVKRRTEAISAATGRPTITETVVPGLTGICTFPDNKQVRGEDGAMTYRTLNVITDYRLRTAATGVQPDIVIYDGCDYVVKRVDPYHRFGAGFVNALAEQVKASTPPAV